MHAEKDKSAIQSTASNARSRQPGGTREGQEDVYNERHKYCLHLWDVWRRDWFHSKLQLFQYACRGRADGTVP